MIATQTTALAGTLAIQLRMNYFIAQANLEDITHEESLVRAADAANNINWLLGHVVTIRCAVFPALKQQPVWAEAQTRFYRRGTNASNDAELLPFDEVRRAFQATQEPLLAGIQALTEEDLAGAAPFSPMGGPETLGSLLAKLPIHEAYHLGQTGILRRIVGKPGAIR